MKTKIRGLGARLKAARLDNGMTQSQLSKKIGVGISMLSHIEHDTRPPKLTTAFRMAEALDVSMDWLCGR